MFGVMSLTESKNEYKLSAIVLVYNGEKFLRPCIQSLVNQTLDGLEIILVDDVSTDDSLYICREFERDYDNVRIIQKEVNGGLASSANLGIKEAKGEYIILVDNDDIVPDYAYEKLYNKAKETDSDVVVGKANYLRGKHQYEMVNYEVNVWEEERTFNPKDYPMVFHENYYWNKIMKKSLLIDNDIQLPVDVKVYADRMFSHTVMTHAKKVSIIPDCVYLWRIRKNALVESLSTRKREVWNYIDRIESFKKNLDYFTSFYNDYFKILMRRVSLPIEGILLDDEFEEVFFNLGSEILIDEFEKMDNPFDNDLKNKDNLFIYLTLNNLRKQSRELLESNLDYQREIYDENGKSYWKLPLFRNPEVDIPDDLFEINFLSSQFVNVDRLSIDDSYIHFENIRFPKHFKMSRIELILKGKTDSEGILEENTIYYDLDKVSDDNVFDLKIPVSDLANLEKYDIYLRSDNGIRRDQCRFTKLSIGEIVNDSRIIKPLFSNNDNLYLLIQNLDEVFNIEFSDTQLKIKFRDDALIKKPLEISVKNTKTKETTLLDFDSEGNEYYLDWKFFLDENSEYQIFLVVYDEYGALDKKIRLDKNLLAGPNNLTKGNLKLIETKYANVNILNE